MSSHIQPNTPHKTTSVARRPMAQKPTVRRSTTDIKFKIVTKKVATKKPFPIQLVASSFAFTLMFLFLLINYATLDQLKDEVESRDKVIEELTIKRDRLEEMVTIKDNYEEIANYAEQELGMVRKDEIENQYYIDIHKQDDVVITEYDDEPENGIGVLLTGVGNVLKNFFNSN